LATDDAATIAETANWTEFKWFYQSDAVVDRSEKKKLDWEFNSGSRNMDNYLEAQLLLIDIFMLAEGDMIMGKFTSNIDRIAFALASAQRRGLIPYHSIDSTWCFDYGSRIGKSQLGTFDC
jgi:hypothetical protein